MHRTLDRWAWEKDSIIGNGWERVGEAVGDSLTIPTCQICLINIIMMMELVLLVYKVPRHRSRFSISIVVCIYPLM